MNFKEFIKNGGLKKLATIKLKSASYSILIYLFSEMLSGVDEIISSRKELSILLGWPEKNIYDGLNELQFCNLIQLVEMPGKPLRIRGQLDLNHWNIIHHDGEAYKKSQLGDSIKLVADIPSHELIQFPINSAKQNVSTSIDHDDSDQEQEIYPTLNDLEAFRKKHIEIDEKIKALALKELEIIKYEKRTLTADEELLLQILSQHHEPRKQLMLALRSNVYYKNLKFFLDTVKSCAEVKDI